MTLFSMFLPRSHDLLCDLEYNYRNYVATLFGRWKTYSVNTLDIHFSSVYTELVVSGSIFSRARNGRRHYNSASPEWCGARCRRNF